MSEFIIRNVALAYLKEAVEKISSLPAEDVVLKSGGWGLCPYDSEETCKEMREHGECFYEGTFTRVKYDDCQYRIQHITNADRIRAMTDEQLAYFLLAVKIDYAGCAFPDHESCPAKGSCYDCWLEWLKEEVKGESDAGKEEMEPSDFKDFCQANLGKILGGDPNG